MSAVDQPSEVASLLARVLLGDMVDHSNPHVRYAVELINSVLSTGATGTDAMAYVRQRLTQPGGEAALASDLRMASDGDNYTSTNLGHAAEGLRSIAFSGHRQVNIAGGSADGSALITGGRIGQVRARSIKIGRLQLGGGQTIAIIVAALVLLTGGAGVIAINTAKNGIKDLALGTWSCTATSGFPSNYRYSADVAIKDGTYQLSGTGFADSGTWTLEGTTLTISSDTEDAYTFFDVPKTATDEMNVKFDYRWNPNESGREGERLFQYSDGVLRFIAIHDADLQISCTKK